MSRSTQGRREPITDRNHVLGWGRYKGESIADLLEVRPDYLVWAHNTLDWFELSAEILDDAEEFSTTTVSESDFNRRIR